MSTLNSGSSQQGKSANWGLKCTDPFGFKGDDGIYDTGFVNQKPSEVGGNKWILLRQILFFSSNVFSLPCRTTSLARWWEGRKHVGWGWGLIWNPCTKLLYFAWIFNGPYQESRSEQTPWKNQVIMCCLISGMTIADSLSLLASLFSWQISMMCLRWRVMDYLDPEVHLYRKESTTPVVSVDLHDSVNILCTSFVWNCSVEMF